MPHRAVAGLLLAGCTSAPAFIVTLELPSARSGGDPFCEVASVAADAVRWTWAIDRIPTGVTTATFPREGMVPDTELACTATLIRHPEATSTARRHLGRGGNVLLIVLDDLGIDKVGAYAAHPAPPPTPTLDQLASEGVLFRRAYAHSVCSPSRAALLTGRYPSRHGVGWWLDLREDRWSLPEREVTVPEVLRDSPLFPYTSIALGKWHLVTTATPEPGTHPHRHGFDHYAGALGNPRMAVEGDGLPRDYTHWEKWTNGERAMVDTYMTTDLANDAVRELPALREPWFAYLAFNAPHSPFHTPPSGLHTIQPIDSVADQYAAMVQAADTEIARILDALDPAVAARTTLIVASDNGTPEEAITPPWDPTRSKHTPYEGGIRVPLIVAGHAVSGPPREVEDLVHLVDVLPTLAELAGTEPRVDSLDGRSFLPVLQDPDAPPARDRLFSEELHRSGRPPWPRREVIALGASHKAVWRPDETWWFDLLGGAWDEGDPLDEASLTPDQQQAQRQLEAFRDAVEAGLSFDSP